MAGVFPYEIKGEQNKAFAGDFERRAEKVWVVSFGFCGRASFSPLKRVVKRTHTAAPPHHAVAPDFAESRSQVNRVVRSLMEQEE